MISMRVKPEKGWYWCLVRGFITHSYVWKEEWIMVEFDQWWRWDMETLRRKQLSDMTQLLRHVGPIEKPLESALAAEVME